MRSLPRSSSSISSSAPSTGTHDKLLDQDHSCSNNKKIPHEHFPSSGDSTIIPFVDESTSSSSDQDLKSEITELSSANLKKKNPDTENNDDEEDSVEKTNNAKVINPGAGKTVITKSQNRQTGWL